MRDQRLPWCPSLGASPQPDGSTHFRVWAPHAERVSLRVRGATVDLEHERLGVFACSVRVDAGADYEYVLEGEEHGTLLGPLPDPCSREQPAGLRGPSRVLDPAAFSWTDAEWRTPALTDLVLYELHVGTFTPEGTFDAVARHLPALAQLGVNAIELMPVADFPGERGWGYDGVYISATHRAYGGPQGLARLVDAAHAAGVAVLLDVVYNHVGASGAPALAAFGPYFTARYETIWGRAINYDDRGCDAVREWVTQSACGWVRDFHVDGLRLDAVHAIFDSSPQHIVAALAERVHQTNPHAVVIAESALNDPKVIRGSDRGGWGCDAQWADDFHHALRVLLTGDRDGYYQEFGRVGDLAKALGRPFVHDGQYSTSRGRRFGASATDRPRSQFVVFDQNHDQVGNRALGDRLPADARPLAAFCTLLAPFVPMLFMGEEYGENAPFLYFCDHVDEELAVATREGRRREFAAFTAFAGDIPDPQSPHTFAASKLTRRGDERLAELYRALLRARLSLNGEARVCFDEHDRWLRARRRGGELLCNFSDERQSFELGPDTAGELVLCTHAHTICEDGPTRLLLPPLAGALVR